MPPRIDWLRTPRNPAMDPRAVYTIAKRRRQILVHSYLYYHLNESIITDELWTQWAQHLARVQKRYGYQIGFYDKAFADWNGTSGFTLSRRDHEVARVASRLLADYQRI